MRLPPKPTLFAIPVAVLVVLALATSSSPAQGRGPCPCCGEPPEPGSMLERMAEQLDLTADQEEALEEAFEKHRNEMRSERKQLRAARETLGEAIHAELFDESAVRDAAAAVSLLESDHAVARARFQQQLRQILTPEQYDELQALRKEHRERWRDRRGERGFRGPGPRRGGF